MSVYSCSSDDMIQNHWVVLDLFWRMCCNLFWKAHFFVFNYIHVQSARKYTVLRTFLWSTLGSNLFNIKQRQMHAPDRIHNFFPCYEWTENIRITKFPKRVLHWILQAVEIHVFIFLYVNLAWWSLFVAYLLIMYGWESNYIVFSNSSVKGWQLHLSIFHFNNYCRLTCCWIVLHLLSTVPC